MHLHQNKFTITHNTCIMFFSVLYYTIYLKQQRANTYLHIHMNFGYYREISMIHRIIIFLKPQHFRAYSSSFAYYVWFEQLKFLAKIISSRHYHKPVDSADFVRMRIKMSWRSNEAIEIIDRRIPSSLFCTARIYIRLELFDFYRFLDFSPIVIISEKKPFFKTKTKKFLKLIWIKTTHTQL